MKISKAELLSLNACSGGYQRFVEQTHYTNEPVDLVTLIGGKNKISDFVWLINVKHSQGHLDARPFFAGLCLLGLEFVKPFFTEQDYNIFVSYLKDYTNVSKATYVEELIYRWCRNEWQATKQYDIAKNIISCVDHFATTASKDLSGLYCFPFYPKLQACSAMMERDFTNEIENLLRDIFKE